MAKAQAVKSKSFFAGLFGGGSSKAKAARPASGASSTLTNVPAGGAGAKAVPKAVAKAEPSRAFAGFRLPFIGAKPITTQMQVLGGAAALLLLATGLAVFIDTQSRTRNSTYVTIASQMQFHTQRLAKAASIAARGQQVAFPQVQDSRDEFQSYLKILQDGGFAFGVDVPSAATNEELKSRLEELARRWPESADAASAIIKARDDLVALSQNIAQIRVGSEEMATLSQELTGMMTQSGSPPAQVLRANRLTFLAERLGRGSAEILGSEVIDPEVPFLIGKDTNDLREIIRALESGGESLGIVQLRDAETRAKLAELKKQFAEFEKNVGPILRELQKLVTARQAGAKLVSGSEQLQSAVGRLQEALQDQKPVASLVAIAVLGAALVLVLALMAFVFLADSRRSAAEAEAENKRNQEAILRSCSPAS